MRKCSHNFAETAAEVEYRIRTVLRYTLVFEHFRARARHRRVYTQTRVRTSGIGNITKVPWNRLDSAAVTTLSLRSWLALK